MRRSPIKRGTKGLKRTTGLKAAAPTADWKRARRVVLERDEGRCQLWQHGHQCMFGLHVHHIQRRSQGGLDVPENLVTLCGVAHEWVHSHVQEAKDLGFLK